MDPVYDLNRMNLSLGILIWSNIRKQVQVLLWFISPSGWWRLQCKHPPCSEIIPWCNPDTIRIKPALCVGSGVEDAACGPSSETNSSAGAQTPLDCAERSATQQPAAAPGRQARQGKPFSPCTPTPKHCIFSQGQQGYELLTSCLLGALLRYICRYLESSSVGL